MSFINGHLKVRTDIKYILEVAEIRKQQHRNKERSNLVQPKQKEIDGDEFAGEEDEVICSDELKSIQPNDEANKKHLHCKQR